MTQKSDLLQQSIDQFWDTIPGVWNKVRSQIHTNAEQFEVTFEQFHILRHVRKGIHSVSELAEVKQISRPAISQAVDLLVERGLLTRRQNSDDRRYVQVELTPEGDALLDAVFQKNREWMKTRLSDLSEQELCAILPALATLKKAFCD